MLGLSGSLVLAQVVPSAAEVARYSGLHAAAHSGDVPLIDKLLSARTSQPVDINARDAYGRTPVHVAAFARQRAADHQRL